MTATASCRVCGAAFTASRAGSTVNCPAHRRRARADRVEASKSVNCSCGKTVIVDGFGHATGNTCPRECG